MNDFYKGIVKIMTNIDIEKAKDIPNRIKFMHQELKLTLLNDKINEKVNADELTDEQYKQLYLALNDVNKRISNIISED